LNQAFSFARSLFTVLSGLSATWVASSANPARIPPFGEERCDFSFGYYALSEWATCEV
jgi:hypothetical protein